MHVNGKMRPVETIPGMPGRGIKEKDGGVNSTTVYFKNFCICYNVSPAQQFKKTVKYGDTNLLTIELKNHL
jgi:hypothetical protein